jgi:single-strand DNA-binding protein
MPDRIFEEKNYNYKSKCRMKNYVQLIGNLGCDPELKTLDNGKRVSKFTLATSDYYKSEEGDKIQETTWHNIVCWNPVAEIAMKHLKKGHLTLVEGKIAYRSYEDKQGHTKYITEIVANNLIILSQKK